MPAHKYLAMAKRQIYKPEYQLNPFLDLTENEFEDLCRDLFAKSSEVTHARRLFGKGYKQYGGDVLIQTGGSEASYVAQCKHYPVEPFSRGDIEQAVDLFVTYWESHWKKFKVSRFYLIVARPLTTDDQALAVHEQRGRLLKLGVDFIYWDSGNLETELKPHRQLVREYLAEYWEKICPPESGAGNAAAGLVGDSVAERLLNRNYEQMASRLSEATRGSLEPIRELARTGRQTEAFDRLGEIKAKDFDYLDGKTRAEVLSLEIRLGFPRQMDAATARRILEQIPREDSDFQTLYLDALITSYEGGLAAALDKLAFCPDVSTFNLKLTLLINSGEFAAAEREYQAESARLKYDAETGRLHAAVLLSLGKTAEAENQINEVFAEKPDWEGVLTIKAIIYYFAGLATAASGAAKNPLAFPQPQPWHLVKTDDESRRKRREAAEIFAARLANDDREFEDRRVLETWHLACLADDPLLQAETLDYCRDLLLNDPAHPYALIWAIDRSFDIDFAAAKNFLAAQFAAVRGDFPEEKLNEALILLPLFLRSDEFERAAAHLEKIKPVLDRIGSSYLTDYWHCQIEIARTKGTSLDARLLNRIENAELRRSLQINALGVRYRQNPSRANRRTLLRRLLKLYRRFGDGLALYNYCLLCHEQKNWREIAFYAQSLLDPIQTPDAVRITANAFYQNKQPQKTLDALNEFRHIFPRSELPGDLSRLKSYALLLSGRPAQAAREARGLFEREKSAENLLALVETARHTDDLFSINRAIEQMPTLEDLTDKQQLRISHLLAVVNPQLATEMWRTVVSRIDEAKDVMDDLYFHGQKLGLGREAEMLFPKVLENARRGSSSSRMINTEDFFEWIKTRTTESDELEKLYQTGQFPVHIYCERRNLPLAELFHASARSNLEIESVTQKRKIMTRNAARPQRLAEVFPRQAEWRFHFDLTTLLLAHELDLLGVVEKCAPVFVSHEIIPFLNHEIEGVQKSPPDALAAIQSVFRTLDANLCRRFVVSHSVSESEREQNASFLKDFSEDDLRILLQAVEEKAAVVVSYPLRNGQNGQVIEVPDNFAEITFDWRNVVAVLLSTDQLSVAQRLIAEAELKKEKWQDRSQFLPPGANLWLTGRAATELAKLGLLEETCRVFPASLDERNETALRGDIRRFEKESETVKWLENLKERLRRGFESEIYQGISLERLREEKIGDEENVPPDYRERSIREILRLVPDDDAKDAAVIDDRFVSRHASVESTIPLFTIYELLEYLKASEFLGEDAYFDCLLRLRERNFRYLSVTSDEILYHFRRATPAQASLDDSRFGRSRELAALRRYFSDCLLDDKLLQRPAPAAADGGANNLGEMRFVLGCERAVTEAIGRVWRKADSLETARTQADLLLFDFYVGSFNLRHFFEDFAVLEAGAYHLASDFVSLSFQGVNLLTAEALTANARTERAAAFFAWVNQIFDAKFRRNPQVVEHAVKILVNAFTLTLASLPDESTESDVEKAQRAALAVLYSQLINFLPEPVRLRLFEMDDLWQSLILPAPEAVVTIGRMKFAAAELWRTLAAALADEPATIRLYNGSKRIFNVTREKDNQKPIAVCLTDESGEFFRLTGIFVGLQLPEKTERETFLTTVREAFDCAEDEMRKAIEEIADTVEPDARAVRFNEWANRSMQIAYQNLSGQISEQKQFSWGGITEIPVESLPKHFRFAFDGEKAQEPFDENIFSRAAEQLLSDEGLETALDRFARFPRPLPEFLVIELQKQDSDARKSLLEKLRTRWLSPVHKLHYLYLALRALPDDEETLRSARKIAGELLRPETPGEQNLEFEVFKVILQLIADEFSRSPATRRWAIPQRLIFAWAHAAEIYNLVAPIADSREEWAKLLEYFNSMRPFWGGEILSFEPEYRSDWLHPRFLERVSFTAFGAGSLFADFPLEGTEKIELPKLLAELCFVEMEGDRVPHYALWKDFSLRANAADSFLDARKLELFYSLVNTENVKFYQPGVLGKYLDQVLDKLADDAQATEVWLELTLLTDGLPLKEVSQTKLAEIVERVDFASLWKDDQEAAWFVLSTIAAQNISFSEELQQKIEGWLIWAVEQLAGIFPSRFNRRMANREEQTQAALRIVNVAAWLAVVPLDPAASSRNWNRLIKRLGLIWSNLHLWLEPFFFRCWTDLPVEQIQGLGRNLLLAKATR